MRLLFGFTVTLLTGCAAVETAECRDAYDIGFRDAIFGLQRQDDLYRPLCSRQGVELDIASYARGWQEGLYEFEQRKMHSGVE